MVICVGGAADSAGAAGGGRGCGGGVRARVPRPAGGGARLVPGRARAPAGGAGAHLRQIPLPDTTTFRPRPRLPRRTARYEVRTKKIYTLIDILY